MKKIIIASISAFAVFCAMSVITSVNVSESSLSELSKANVEALAAPQKAEKKVETVADFMREYFGCPGGNNKCFTGSISYGGAAINGTWYMK